MTIPAGPNFFNASSGGIRIPASDRSAKQWQLWTNPTLRESCEAGKHKESPKEKTWVSMTCSCLIDVCCCFFLCVFACFELMVVTSYDFHIDGLCWLYRASLGCTDAGWNPLEVVKQVSPKKLI